MNKLINIKNENGKLVVNSRQIADDFGKNHRDVLKAIDDLITQMGGAEKCADLFIETEYRHQQNFQIYREYLLTRDGFTLLAMGFTGTKALEWKLKYIQAFNKMEEQLKNPYKGLSKEVQAIFALDQKTQEIETRMDTLENDLPLFNIECKELQGLVRKVGIKTLGGYKTPAYNSNSLRGQVYSDIQQQLKREFGVTRYEAIKRSQLDLARQIVAKYKVPVFLQGEIIKFNNQIQF